MEVWAAEAKASCLRELALAHHRIGSSSLFRSAWIELACGPGSHLSCDSVNSVVSRTLTSPLRPREGAGEGFQYD